MADELDKDKVDERKGGITGVRHGDEAPSGAPTSGWAIGDRFSWEEIHQRVVASADEEINHSLRFLFVGGLTAGFAIMLTFIGHMVGRAQFPHNDFAAALLYPIGFVYIVLGRYQLYTENTLPPVKLVMTRLASLPLLLRLWGIVLLGNVLGAGFGALIVARTEVLSPDAMLMGMRVVEELLKLDWWDVFFKALFAGWLVAGVVWLSTAARDTMVRLMLVYLVFYTIAAADLLHIITSTSELFFYVFRGETGPGLLNLCWDLWVPVLLGNTAGGVLLFAVASYAQTSQRRYPEVRVLSLREVLFSRKGGRPFSTPRPRPGWKEEDDEDNEDSAPQVDSPQGEAQPDEPRASDDRTNP